MLTLVSNCDNCTSTHSYIKGKNGFKVLICYYIPNVAFETDLVQVVIFWGLYNLEKQMLSANKRFPCTFVMKRHKCLML